MKLSFRRNIGNNKIYGIELTLTKPKCNQHDCPYSTNCSKYSSFPIYIKKINKVLRKIHFWFRHSSVANLSGTKHCPYKLNRKYSCEDCKHIRYDTSFNGYCAARDNIQVFDENGHHSTYAVGSCCIKQDVSDLAQNWDIETGKIKI